jgi:transposase
VFAIKTFYCSAAYCVSVERKRRRELSVRVARSEDSIYRIVKQFEKTGNVIDKHAKGRKGSTSVLMEEGAVQHGRQ